jgi:AAA domain
MSESPHPSGLSLTKADLSRARPPRWAWNGRIPLGVLSLLIGNEGVGKGTLIAWIVARITRGELPGHLFGKPSMVGILGDEDSFYGVWTPRLHAAGADLDLVQQIERPDGGFVSLREDRDALALAVDLERVRVLFFDQLLDNLGAGTNDYRQKEVRDALQPLRAIARDFDLAAFGSLHPNKRGDTFRQLVAGAAAFNAVSRSSLLLAEHPDDEHRRVLVRGKGNLSALPPAFEFELTGHSFEANGHIFNVPLATAFCESSISAEELIGPASDMRPAGEARTDARALIAARLSDGDWHPAGLIIERCEERGSHTRAVERAANDLGVEKKRHGFPAVSHWRLPQIRQGDTPVSPVMSVASVASAASGRDDSDDGDDRRHNGDGPVAAATNVLADEEIEPLFDPERMEA